MGRNLSLNFIVYLCDIIREVTFLDVTLTLILTVIDYYDIFNELKNIFKYYYLLYKTFQIKI